MADSDNEHRGRRIMGGYKHDGSKGPKYTKWKERFLDDAEGQGDADWSMAACLQGTDGPQGGLGAAAAKARGKRRRMAFSELMNSLDDDSCRDLKTMIRANANGNGRAAFIILERECGETTSALEEGVKVAEWHQLSVEKDVGAVGGDGVSTSGSTSCMHALVLKRVRRLRRHGLRADDPCASTAPLLAEELPAQPKY